MAEFLTQEELDDLLGYAGDECTQHTHKTEFTELDKLIKCIGTFNNRENYSKKELMLALAELLEQVESLEDFVESVAYENFGFLRTDNLSHYIKTLNRLDLIKDS